VPKEWIFQDEGYSGASLIRPGLEAVRDLAAEGHIEAVLIHSPDRLSRKYAYQVLLAEEFSKHGVELRFVKSPFGYHPEGSTAGPVPRHDRRIRARADTGALAER
jgi:site-specific DNA recombinase